MGKVGISIIWTQDVMMFFQIFTVFLFVWRGWVILWKFMTMIKIKLDAINSRPCIFQHRPAEIPLTVKWCTVHQISMTSMWSFVRLLLKEVLARSCLAHTLKIWIKYFPHLMTGFYGHSMLRECTIRNNNLSAPKVLKLFFSWSCCGEKSAWNSLIPPYYQWQRISW